MWSDVVDVARLLRSFANVHVIVWATRKNIFSIVSKGGVTSVELSTAVDIPLARLEPVLAILDGMKLIEVLPSGAINATGRTTVLAQESGELYGQALLTGSIYFRLWENLDHALGSGDSVFGQEFGASFWDYMENNESEAELFMRTMGVGGQKCAQAIVESNLLKKTGTVVDIGAGDGALLTSLCSMGLVSRGIAFELPAQAARIRAALAQNADAKAQYEVVGGDMFKKVPAGGDLYILKGVLHNWNDGDCRRLLRSVRHVCSSTARIWVIERVATTGGNSGMNQLTMLMLFGAKERSEYDFLQLFRAEGFALRQSSMLSDGNTVLEISAVSLSQ